MFPTFSKTGVPTFTFSSESVFPFRRSRFPNQIVGVSDTNTIRVASLGTPRFLYQVQWLQLEAIDITGLDAFFSNPLINDGLFSFTWTDELGINRTVQWLEPELDYNELSATTVQLTMTLTQL